jgi:hypothetical protein
MAFKASRRDLIIGGAASIIGTSLALAQDDRPLAEAQPTPPPQLTITEQMLHETVLLECANAAGQIFSIGTGFFFSFFSHGGTSVAALITNKHVVERATEVFTTFTVKKADGTPDFGNNKRVKLSQLTAVWIPHPDPHTDLIAAMVGPGFQSLFEKGEHYMMATCDQSLIPTDEDLKKLTPVEEVLVVGYPDGISDTTNNIPVFRRGVTATPVYLNFRGDPFFLLDAAIFPGSSGSPVFLYNQGAWSDRAGHLQLGNRTALIGIIFGVYNHTTDGKIVMQPAPTQLSPMVKSLIPNNLGLCIKASKILDFEPVLVNLGVKIPDGYSVRSRQSL